MVWPSGDDDETPPRTWLGWLREAIDGLPRSAYWSGILKDIGKLLLLGAAIAPFFGLDGKVASLSLSLFGALAALVILYVGYLVDPNERRKE